MRALVLRDFGELAIEEIPDPEPGAGELLLKIVATGICGSDVHGFTGENGRRQPGQIMGHETVGVVVGEGPDPSRTGTLGSLVTVNPVLACGTCASCEQGRDNTCQTRKVIGVNAEIQAAFAEYLAVPAANAIPLPDGIPGEYGALVEPLAVGAHAVAQGGCADGERVLVAGGGPIGQACALAALRRGATVAVSEPDPRRRDLAQRLGAASVDPGAEDAGEAAARLLGGRPTLAVDAVGSSASLAACLAATPLGGRVVLVGMNEPRLDLDAYAVSTAERMMVGSFAYSATHFAETAAWVASGPPELELLIDERVGFAGAAGAFERAARGEVGPGKVLVLPGKSP